MPELPEVETVRRMLEGQVLGRRIAAVKRSRHALRREPPDRAGLRRAVGRAIVTVRRHGKYLLLDLEGGVSLLSHLGMSGRWLFVADRGARAPKHVHAEMAFEDGSALRFQDPRRFGLLRVLPTATAFEDRALAGLGPDPVAAPPTGALLHRLALGAQVSAKTFLLDQRRIAGIGNIYASEILHRAGVHPARIAARLGAGEWARVAAETSAVLGEAIDRMGTTFSTFRSLWNEPGTYGEQLRVYDRGGDPCRFCGVPIVRVYQQQRSTFFCPRCQPKAGRSPIRTRKTASNSRPSTQRARDRLRPHPERRKSSAKRR